MNAVVLIGLIGKDVEINTSKAGKPYCRFNVATTSVQKDAEPITNWINCVAFGKNAEKLAGVKKGARVWVDGTLTSGSYEKNGAKVFTLNVTVNHIATAPKQEAVKQEAVQETTLVGQPLMTSFEDDSIPF